MCTITLHPSKKFLAFFNHNNEEHLIFYYRETGVIKKILTRTFNLLDLMVRHYSKVSVILLQLHTKENTKNNKLITIFIQKLKQQLKSHYSSKIGYLWIRERHKVETPHYHVAIMLSGHVCQNTFVVDTKTQALWQAIIPNGFSFRIRNRIYRISRNGNQSELRAVRLRLSYFAKKHSKEFSNHTFNCFGMSHSV